MLTINGWHLFANWWMKEPYMKAWKFWSWEPAGGWHTEGDNYCEIMWNLCIIQLWGFRLNLQQIHRQKIQG